MSEGSTVRRIVIVFAMLLVAASCGNDDDPTLTDDDPTLTGVWLGTELGGTGEEWTFTFDVTDASVTSDGTELYEATYITFPDENPKRIDITITDSSFPPFVGLIARAIYEFDGDTLILASNEPGVVDTPTVFVPGGGTRVWELAKQ